MHKQIEDVRESGILPWTVSCAVVNCFPAAGLWGPDFQGRIRRAFGHDAPAGWRSGEPDQSTSCAKQARFTRLGEMSESYDDLLKTGTLCNLKQEHSKTIHCLFLPSNPCSRVSGGYARRLNSHTHLSLISSLLFKCFLTEAEQETSADLWCVDTEIEGKKNKMVTWYTYTSSSM